jgi:hypothetical protein
MDAPELIAVFEAASAGQYGPMVDRATDASHGDPTVLLLALVRTCCGLADRLSGLTGRSAPDVLAEQAELTVSSGGTGSTRAA